MLGMVGLAVIIGNSTERMLMTSNFKRHRNRARQRLQERREKMSDRERAILAAIQKQVSSEHPKRSHRNCAECGRHCILITVEGIEIDYCIRCRSFWFDPGELMLVTRKAKDIPSDDCRHRNSARKCPDCGAYMREFVYLKPYWVLVDRCPAGHGVYLQDHELEQIFEVT